MLGVVAAAHREDAPLGRVVAVVETAHRRHRRITNVVGRKTNGRPAIGVGGVAHSAQKFPHIAVGLVQITLVVLLQNHSFLGFEHLVRDVEPAHTVAFEPQRSLDIILGKSDVIVGIIVVGKRIVFAAGKLQRRVKIGYVASTPKHQVLK